LDVTLNIRVTGVDGRSVSFEFDGSDGIDTICRGRHQRFVVDVKKTEARILAKAQKAQKA
jgi:fluoroacetyl-CoA thioesterase